MALLSKNLVYNWAKSKKREEPVEIQDESLRDGLQASYVRHPTAQEKLKLINLMEKIGINGADIGFPASSKKNFEDVVVIGRYKLANKLAINLSCAARTVISDITPIVNASDKIGLPLEADIFIGSSQIRKLVEDWDLEQMIKLVEESVSYAVKNGLPVMFVTEDSTRAQPEVMKDLYNAALSSGAKRICITDTVGFASPEIVEKLLTFIFDKVVSRSGDIKVDWHGHNDRGLEVSNALAAAKLGVDRIHGTALGIGERSGNTPMHKLLVNLEMEGYVGDINLSYLSEYSKFSSKIFKIPIPVNEPMIGDQSFTTASGVHAAATIKAIKTEPELAGTVYSGVDLIKIGREVDIQIGPMSGKANIEWVLSKLKIKTTDLLVKKILDYVKRKNKVLTHKEVKLFLRDFKRKKL